MPLKIYAETDVLKRGGGYNKKPGRFFFFFFSSVSNIRQLFEDNAKAQTDIRSENFNHQN